MCACLCMRVDKTRFSEDCEWCLENSLQQCLGVLGGCQGVAKMCFLASCYVVVLRVLAKVFVVVLTFPLSIDFCDLLEP